MSFLTKIEVVSDLDSVIIKDVGVMAFDILQRLRAKPIEDQQHLEKLKLVVDYLAALPEILTGRPTVLTNMKKLQELVK